ncbi:CusB/HlyD membrane fusion family barrel-sandwich protein [Acinetobacter calcoaceticus]|uniref:CusB/HlyD membrane fusion family barrel-sandwich protein n=1 Tax=Acinetobacter calcoaceticus TaxID=471 RepID=A0A4R1XC04_ACICA|nr:CusB/HlyD membrane fusion family barrel-sandwich protein [Acinetobacter calcoaceticus]
MGKLQQIVQGRILYLILFILAVLILIGGLAYRSQADAGKTAPESATQDRQAASNPNLILISTEQEKIAGIETELLKTADAQATANIQLQGQAFWSTQNKTLVTSPIAGVVQQIYVQAYDQVQANQKIVAIYSPELLQIQNELLQLRSKQQLYAKQLAREQQLFVEGIIAEKRIFEAQSQLQQVSIDLQAKQRMLQLMGADATAGLNALALIKSPRLGVIDNLSVTLGQQVEAGAVIGEMSNPLQPLMLKLQLPLSQAGQIQLGNAVTVAGCSITGQIIKIAPMLQDNTQMQELHVQMAQHDPCLKVNQFVKANISSPIQSQVALWSVPSAALSLKDAKHYLFVKQQSKANPGAASNAKAAVQNGYVATAVEVHHSDEQHSLVSASSLSAGQSIAVSKVEQLKAIWNGFGADQAMGQ